ncbi:GNAT family N-acetyltransferase [Spirilliplanes yamanashiensis]|nr:GNAT family N-acetyltransferase [Spirilliplanes yamanashiensis]MDP9817121.1 ribosomal protein S18 acetylase RimI-like enzyme [Spirilliplanes yamanashiensis]
MTSLTVGAADPELEKRLSDELDAINVAAIGAGEERPFSIRLTTADGELAGGLTGWTWDRCGGISSLWVAESLRGQGWGARLMAAAEREIAARGCDRALVSTMSFQAPGFYRRLGYDEIGRVPDMPGGSAKHQFHKRLSGPPRLRLVAIVEDCTPAVRAYEDAVLALLPRHGGRLEHRLISVDGRTEVQTISFAGESGYHAFLADPQRAAHRAALGGEAPNARVVPIA